jgi:anti-sigma regulatory factor (Ser/Thr protein kinase)
MAATSGAAGNAAAGTGTSSSPELRWRQVYRGDEEQIGELRRWLAGLLPKCGARDDVVTVAVELATNAVRHTASGRGGWFALEITWHRVAVRVAVADGGAAAEPHLVDDPMGEGGRGLQVVHALSSRTGVAGDQRGRLVWAEIPWAADTTDESAAAVCTAMFQDGYEAAIRDGQDTLARRHVGVPTWFGRATMQWWALAGHPGPTRLLAASSPEELSELLDSVTVPQRTRPRRRGAGYGRKPSGAKDPASRASPATGRDSTADGGDFRDGLAVLPRARELPPAREMPRIGAAVANTALQAS